MREPDSKRPLRRLRVLATVAAVLVPLIPIVIALEISGARTPAAARTTTSASAPLHLSAVPNPPKAARGPNLRLPPGKGALVALVHGSTRMRTRPGGHVFARVPARTNFGSPEAMWVARLSGRWLGVVSSLAGNGRLGWIPATSASLSRVDWELKVSLSGRKLTVLHNGHQVERYSVAIGAPTAPTPTGRFSVTDRLSTGDPAGPYGCCILALSAKAPHAIQDWSGGNRIAIHSTPETSSIGQPVSHGCMRLTLPEGQWLLRHIPLGTPTLISS
jgi:lipoprotein-anchoring transpeptidase ErfK/SrfK